MDRIIMISAIVSAVATGVIAFYSIASFRLTRQLSKSSDRYQSQFMDLLQAMVVSQMTHRAGGFVSTAITQFKRYYKGKTEIF